MIQSPTQLLTLINQGLLVTGLSDREINSPEGVGFDLTLGDLSVLSGGAGSLRVETRKTPSHTAITPDNTNCYSLEPSKIYIATTLEKFDLPDDLAAIFFPRSTLFRSGVAFQASILPPGYKGSMNFQLVNNFDKSFEIEQGARFAHVVFIKVEGDVNKYIGQWQGGRVTQSGFERQI